MVRFILAFCVSLGGVPLAAQQIDTPLQAERLQLTTCLFAAEPLAPTYRTHITKSCVEIPLKICGLRGSAVACLTDTLADLDGFYQVARARLPDEIDGKPFKTRAYRRALRTIDDAFADSPTPVTEPVLAESYQIKAQAIVDMFYRARQADVSLKGLWK